MEVASAPFLQQQGEQDKFFQSHSNPLLYNPGVILDHLEKTREKWTFIYSLVGKMLSKVWK